MRYIHNLHTRQQKLPILLYATIVLLWIQVFSGVAIGLLFGHTDLLWLEIFKDIGFAGLVTVTVTRSYRQFRTYLTGREKDYLKLFLKNPHPMWIYDLATMRFLLVNEAAVRLYGYSEAEFLSMSIKDIRPREDVPVLISETDRIKLNFNLDYHWSGTWRHKKKNDELMYVEISSHEIIFEGKKAEIVLAYNVTEQVSKDLKLQLLNQDLELKVAERTNDLLATNRKLIDQNKIIRSSNLELFSLSSELQEANDRIRKHADIKNRFVSMVSHEFRTPLSSIRFAAGFVGRYYGRADEAMIFDKIRNIEKQVAHMTHMLDDVLTIGKADSNKIEVNTEEVHLHDFVHKLAYEVQQANNNTHDILPAVDDKVPEKIQSDEKLLRNIFINLLNNAVKYSPDSHVVYFDVIQADDAIRFQVKDHGLGISPAEVDKVFEPFYRISTDTDIQGTGLGLSIVKRAAGLVNAVVSVQSKPGEGSVFTVVLPVEAQKPASIQRLDKDFLTDASSAA